VIGLARFLPESRKTLDEIASGDEPPLATEAERALRLSGLLGEARAAKGASAPAAEARAVLPGAGSRPGDAAAGERLFFHPRGPRCSACHTVAGRGGAAGPDLSRAGRTPPERLLEAIVAPSKEIAPGYTTWVLVTPAGAKHGVLVGEEADGALLLAGPEGRIERLPPGEVAERSPSPTSLMPEDLVGALAEDELRDLLAFLASLK
jgi:putative heme-binding domain-containing protein